MNSYYLECKYDTRKSFYKKARVEVIGGIETLYSYDTCVLSYNKVTKELKRFWGGSSMTTNRHITEFLKQLGIYDYYADYRKLEHLEILICE